MDLPIVVVLFCFPSYPQDGPKIICLDLSLSPRADYPKCLYGDLINMSIN